MLEPTAIACVSMVDGQGSDALVEEPVMSTMMAIVVFSGSFGAATWSIYATLRPELARIADLLRHGPVETVPALPAFTARGTARVVSGRAVRSSAPMRAVA